MVESVSMPLLEIKGRHDLKIIFNNLCPEEILKEKSLVGLKGKELKHALKLPFYTSDELEIAYTIIYAETIKSLEMTGI